MSGAHWPETEELPAAAERAGRWQRWGLTGLMVLSLAALFGPTLAHHVATSASPWVFNDDARQQLVPFIRYQDPTLLRDDYVGDYYRAGFPLGYRALYTAAAWLGVSPTLLGKVLTYVLLLVTLVTLGMAAQPIGGKAAAWSAVAISLGSSLYLARIAGGLPRSFALPLVACALAASAHGRVRLGGGLILVAAAFYPVVPVVTGLHLAVILLLLPARDRGEAESWSFRRRLVFLGLVAAGAIALMMPPAVALSPYGAAIRPAQVAEYPEAGPGGRYDPEDRPPFASFLKLAPAFAAGAVLGNGPPWLPAARDWLSGDRLGLALGSLLLVVLLGWLGLLRHDSAARRVACLLVAAWAAHVLARALAPRLFLPQRYVIYTVTLLAPLMVSTCLAGFLRRRPTTERPGVVQEAAVGALGLLVVLVLGGRGDPAAGLVLDVEAERGILEAVAALPPDALIAGWPTGVVENVPYASRRRALVTYETHQAFHVGYVLEMRRRMRLLVDAYFATSPAPLVRLRDELGVTHLVVDLAHYRGSPPWYFRPFGAWVAQAVADARGQGYEVLRQLGRAAVFRCADQAILELGRIDQSADRQGRNGLGRSLVTSPAASPGPGPAAAGGSSPPGS